jgi:hypothetical protein
MPTERTTVIVSVNTEADEDARIAQINKQVGDGWRVLHAIPIEGSTSGPGGNATPFMRMQVTLERELQEHRSPEASAGPGEGRAGTDDDRGPGGR